MSRARALAWAAALAAACTAQTRVPGDTVVGAFDFETTLMRNGCPFDAGGETSLTATLSYDSTTGSAYLTSSTVNMTGTLTGDVLRLVGQAPRGIPAASCKGALSEEIVARMIGEAEARAAQSSCDTIAVLDGGPDAGQGDAGLDVRLICGSVYDRLSGTADAGESEACRLAECELEYRLKGERRQ